MPFHNISSGQIYLPNQRIAPWAGTICQFLVPLHGIARTFQPISLIFLRHFSSIQSLAVKSRHSCPTSVVIRREFYCLTKTKTGNPFPINWQKGFLLCNTLIQPTPPLLINSQTNCAYFYNATVPRSTLLSSCASVLIAPPVTAWVQSWVINSLGSVFPTA